jgi:hypothetical protein
MRVYTLEEARALLPRVVPVLQQLREVFKALRAMEAETSAAAGGASGNGHLGEDPWAEGGQNRIEELNRALRRLAAQLEAWGVELKDPEKGLIDFYTRRQGELVYLCFMLGEDDIAYWHSLQAGFAGRQPL